MTETAQKDTLDAVVPKTLTVTLSTGEEVVVKHIKVGKITALITSARPLLAEMTFPGKTPETAPVNAMEVFLRHPDEVLGLLGIILDKDATWMGDLDVDDLMLLLTEVVTLNVDFFTQRVLPFVLRGMVQLNALLPKNQKA